MDILELRGRIVRLILRILAIIGDKLLLRTTIEGRENLPDSGSVIYAANHAAVYDGVLYFAYLPLRTQIVGPGDFQLRFPNRIPMEWTNIILVNRGASDRSSLREMVRTLKDGGQLALFPEGGTWEKSLYDVKNGAAYVSMLAQAPIVPIAISGTYDIWGDIWRFKRPKITMKILPPIEPVSNDIDRSERKEALEQASYDLMTIIYANLEDEELNRYKLYMKQKFHGEFHVAGQPDVFADAPNYKVLAEIVSKKNLFSTFHEHLNLPLAPFLHLNKPFSARRVRRAAQAMHHALEHDIEHYINYRLGEVAARDIMLELTDIQERLANVPASVQVQYDVTIEEIEDADADEKIETVSEALAREAS